MRPKSEYFLHVQSNQIDSAHPFKMKELVPKNLLNSVSGVKVGGFGWIFGACVESHPWTNLTWLTVLSPLTVFIRIDKGEICQVFEVLFRPAEIHGCVGTKFRGPLGCVLFLSLQRIPIQSSRKV